jgi:hypothetical protein
MNFMKLGSLTINLNQVAYWTVLPIEEHKKNPNPLSPPPDYFPFFRPSDESVVIIYFVGTVEPLKLANTPARAFLKLIHECGEIRDAQLEPPPVATSEGRS